MRERENRPQQIIRGAVEFVNEIPVHVGTYAQRLIEERGVWSLIKAGGIPVVTSLTALGMVLSGDLDPGLRYYTVAVATVLHVGHTKHYPQWPRVFRLDKTKNSV